jgi:hypothetical protein
MARFMNKGGLPAVLGISLLTVWGASTVHAQEGVLSTDAWLVLRSDKVLGQRERFGTLSETAAGVGVGYSLSNMSSRLVLNFDDENDLTLDGSFIQYTAGIATFGAGAVDRHWSYSPRTSLILSSNARPSASVYMKLDADEAPRARFLSWMGPWSFEFFNGVTESSVNPDDSMVMGMRLTMAPVAGLELEFVRTAHWGGSGYDSGWSGFTDALFANTNEGSAANIDQLAGIGFSYKLPETIAPIRLYGQIIGEDEAGGLPNCFMHLAGLEWTGAISGRPTVLGLEYVDTRIKRTSGGYCGPNTAYNNNTYQYTNDDVVMGAPIDTEGTSLEVFGVTQLSPILNLDYSLGYVVVNDANWGGHRLSSTREEGWIGSVGLSWQRDALQIRGGLSYQEFDLDRADIPSGVSVGVSASMSF